MIFEIRSPYLKTVVVPARFGTFIVSAAKLPAGRNRPISGSIMSLTKAFTSADAALSNYESNCKSDYSESLKEVKEFLSKSTFLLF